MIASRWLFLYDLYGNIPLLSKYLASRKSKFVTITSDIQILVTLKPIFMLQYATRLLILYTKQLVGLEILNGQILSKFTLFLQSPRNKYNLDSYIFLKFEVSTLFSL
jgi:hypothetical protein